MISKPADSRDQSPQRDAAQSATIRDRRDERRSAAELANDHRLEAVEREREGSRVATAINVAERRAQAMLAARLPEQPTLAWARTYAHPSPRSIRSFAPCSTSLMEYSRPAGRDGAVSFHFHFTPIAKGDELKAALLNPSLAAKLRSTVGTHQKYIEREAAVERSGGIAAMGQRYLNESLDRMEQEHDADVFASFGSLPESMSARMDFWLLAEKWDKNPHHAVRIVPDADAEIWERVRKLAADEPSLPEAIAAALGVNVPSAFEADTDAALAVVKLFYKAGQREGFDGRKKSASPVISNPVSITLGRGGVVQLRLVAELPHEMTPRERLALAKDFCADYDSKSLPYWAVIHAPTAANHSKNFHLHINLSLRPAEMIQLKDGSKVWDFAHEYLEHDEKHRTFRPKRLNQNKIMKMTKNKFFGEERTRFSIITNEHLQKAGYSKRVDPRTYAEMGIEREARRRLPQREYNLERRGERTEGGDQLAATEWHNHLTALNAEAESFKSCVWKIGKVLIDAHSTATASAAGRAGDIDAAIRGCCAALVERGLDEIGKRYVAERLSSRPRLKSPDKRDEVDEAAVAAAAELNADAHELHVRLQRELQDMEMEVERLVKDKTERVHQRAALDETQRATKPQGVRTDLPSLIPDHRGDARSKQEPAIPSTTSTAAKPSIAVATASTPAASTATASHHDRLRAGRSESELRLKPAGTTHPRPAPSTNKGSSAVTPTMAGTPKKDTPAARSMPALAPHAPASAKAARPARRYGVDPPTMANAAAVQRRVLIVQQRMKSGKGML